MAIIEITADNFDGEIINSGKRVLLDFWAPWCVPCRKMTQLIEELDGEQPDVQMAKLDIEAQPQLAAKLGIMSIPALIYFKDGKQVKNVVGVQSKKAVLKILSK